MVGASGAIAGLLGALLSGAGTAVGCWLVCLGLVAWAPGVVADAASSSALLQLAPVPRTALEQAEALGSWFVGQYGTWH